MSQNTSPDNVPSATKGTADSLAAPGRVGAGGNRAQWLAIGDFLARQNLRLVLQERARSAAAQALACGSGAQGAQLSTLPVGNHGEIVAKGVGV